MFLPSLTMPNAFYNLLARTCLWSCLMLLFQILTQIPRIPFSASYNGFKNVTPMFSRIGFNDIGSRFQNVDAILCFGFWNSSAPAMYQTTTPMFGPFNITLQKPSITIPLRPTIKDLKEIILNDSGALQKLIPSFVKTGYALVVFLEDEFHLHRGSRCQSQNAPTNGPFQIHGSCKNSLNWIIVGNSFDLVSSCRTVPIRNGQ